ncbi:hypothetical protein ACPOL_6602 [Acidisarcina polymorpha]|uniref:Uncharacterized protein n=1 Tax=Acidisarcina polymorpha TaxID=2211140 RepID=A0A2Z5GAS4_9BACT|nr:hypothetical protein ACPOL_6602 [Acidisarcina polymorpha]
MRPANTMVDGPQAARNRLLCRFGCVSGWGELGQGLDVAVGQAGQHVGQILRMGTSSLRQLSTIEKMAAIFGPASWLPRCSQLRRPIAIGLIEFSAKFVDSSITGRSMNRVSFCQRFNVYEIA